MEQHMKLAATIIRRLRIERGWSQEQLAIASGLSLRTIQRVEAEGTASLSTAASLAATFGVSLVQLQEAHAPQTDPSPPARYALLLSGLAMIMLAVIGESARLPVDPRSDAMAALNVLAAFLGTYLALPAGLYLCKRGKSAAVALAVMGIPLLTLLAGSLLVALFTGHSPLWAAIGMGAAGAALSFMSIREFRRNGSLSTGT